MFPVSLLLIFSCVIRNIWLAWYGTFGHSRRLAEMCLRGVASRPPPDRRLDEFTALPAQSPRVLRVTVEMLV